MANYVKSVLYIEEKYVEKVSDCLRSDEADVDFNNLIPMPDWVMRDCYGKEADSLSAYRYLHGYSMDMNMCSLVNMYQHKGENLDDVITLAKAFAEKTGTVIAITGAIDIVADSNKAYCIRNGHPMMSSVTGTGCQLSAMTAAFVAANPDHPLEAAAAAVAAMGYAGEVAHNRLTEMDGNATYRNYIIDAIYNMTPEMLEKGANYEVR